MSQINNQPASGAGDDPDGQGNGLVKLSIDGPASNLDAATFVAVAWRLQARAARLMPASFELYSGGRWRTGSAGDYIVLGAGGEVAIVSGRDFPQLCRVE